MSSEVTETTAVAVREQRSVVLSPVMDLHTAKARMKDFQEFVAHYLEPSTDGGQDGGDYGPIPGAGKKKVLLKSGADKLGELYGLYDEYDIEAKEDFESRLFYYKIKCILRSRRDDSIVGTGVGSCSTYESKYRWRDSQRVCPKCQSSAIIKGKEEYGGGWLCFAKKGGCGAKFQVGDASIEGQSIGRVENPDILDTVNTVLKMAKKRAKIDAIIGVTRSSGIFTQDLEDVAMPPKPAVETIDHDIDLGSPAKGSAVGNKEAPASGASSKATTAKASKKAAGAVGPEPAAPSDEQAKSLDEYCTKEMQDWLRMKFKDALPAKYQPHSDQLRRDWLAMRGYKDDKGVGTSKKIPLVLFKAVARDALNHAKGLEG